LLRGITLRIEVSERALHGGTLERNPLRGLLRSEVGGVLLRHLLGGNLLRIYAWSKEVGVLDGLKPYAVTTTTCNKREYEQNE
jgi:hypothetical protein